MRTLQLCRTVGRTYIHPFNHSTHSKFKQQWRRRKRGDRRKESEAGEITTTSTNQPTINDCNNYIVILLVL